jgi:hypothetical protein
MATNAHRYWQRKKDEDEGEYQNFVRSAAQCGFELGEKVDQATIARCTETVFQVCAWYAANPADKGKRENSE